VAARAAVLASAMLWPRYSVSPILPVVDQEVT
jgi:hypothetical protein